MKIDKQKRWNAIKFVIRTIVPTFLMYAFVPTLIELTENANSVLLMDKL